MNEEILIYNTQNSGETLKNIKQYEFKRIWKNNLNKNNKNLLGGILFLLLAGFMLFLKQSFGYFFVGVGSMYLVLFFNYISIYRKAKKVYNDFSINEIEELDRNSKDVIWEFTPTYFKFSNFKSEFKFAWEGITYCILDDKYLYITVITHLNFILDKANIDENNFNKTIEYLNNKSKLKAI